MCKSWGAAAKVEEAENKRTCCQDLSLSPAFQRWVSGLGSWGPCCCRGRGTRVSEGTSCLTAFLWGYFCGGEVHGKPIPRYFQPYQHVQTKPLKPFLLLTAKVQKFLLRTWMRKKQNVPQAAQRRAPSPMDTSWESPCPTTTILPHHGLIWRPQTSSALLCTPTLGCTSLGQRRLGLPHTLHQVSQVPVPSHPTAPRTQMVSLWSHQELHFSIRKL